MENRAHALLAGLFVLLLGAATVFALWWFSGEREATADYELVSDGNVSGLNVQAQVRYRGMSAGKVMDIRVPGDDPRLIVVTIRIRRDLPVTQGTRATLGYQGVTGLAFINLDERGEDPRPLPAGPEGLPRLTLEPAVMERLSDGVLGAVERFNRVADQFGAFLDDTSLQRFRSTLERLESAAGGLDRTFETAPRTLEAVQALFSADNLARWSAMLAHLESASAEVGPALAEMRDLMRSLQHTLSSVEALTVEAADGVLHDTLPQVNALIGEINTTAVQLGRLVESLEASPQMLITGRGAQRPGPGEHGFAP